MKGIVENDSTAFKRETHEVVNIDRPQRLSDYCVGIFESISSRKGIKKAIKKSWITVDGKIGQTGDWVQKGQKISLSIPSIKHDDIYLDYKLPIIYEDDYLAVVDKPAGIAVSGNYRHTLQSVFPQKIKTSPQPDALQIPEPIHRLDYATSGLLLIGKTRNATALLNAAFEKREVKKFYQARVKGLAPFRSKIFLPIHGKPAVTFVNTVKSGVDQSLLEIQILTGRTHQIRKHLAAIGHQVVGDTKYGNEWNSNMKLCLRSTQLSFMHPISDIRMEFRVFGL